MEEWVNDEFFLEIFPSTCRRFVWEVFFQSRTCKILPKQVESIVEYAVGLCFHLELLIWFVCSGLGYLKEGSFCGCNTCLN